MPITLATAGEIIRFIKNSETKFQPASTKKINLNEDEAVEKPSNVWIVAISLKKNKSIAITKSPVLIIGADTDAIIVVSVIFLFLKTLFSP